MCCLFIVRSRESGATSAVQHLLLVRFSKLALHTLGVWPRSFLSHPVCSACLAGVATYGCVAHLGYWDPQGPDLSNCTSPWVNHIMQKVSPNDAAVKLPPEFMSCGRRHFSPAEKDLGHASVFICSPQYIVMHRALPLRGGAGKWKCPIRSFSRTRRWLQ